MPTYEYACADCGQHLEVVQSFTDDSLSVCPNCGGTLRKVFGTIGIVLKGSGFYKTDSRASGSKAGGNRDGVQEAGGDSGGGDSAGGDTGPKAPAAAKAAR